MVVAEANTQSHETAAEPIGTRVQIIDGAVREKQIIDNAVSSLVNSKGLEEALSSFEREFQEFKLEEDIFKMFGRDTLRYHSCIFGTSPIYGVVGLLNFGSGFATLVRTYESSDNRRIYPRLYHKKEPDKGEIVCYQSLPLAMLAYDLNGSIQTKKFLEYNGLEAAVSFERLRKLEILKTEIPGEAVFFAFYDDMQNHSLKHIIVGRDNNQKERRKILISSKSLSQMLPLIQLGVKKYGYETAILKKEIEKNIHGEGRNFMVEGVIPVPSKYSNFEISSNYHP